MSTPGLPDFPAPPKHMQKRSQAERDRRRACHGNWHACEQEHVMSDGPTTGTVRSSELGDDWTAKSHLDKSRDRMVNPSINWPRSEQEAAQALLLATRQALFQGPRGPLARFYTTDAGLSMTRSQQQADWLTQQQAILAVLFEEFIDSLDVTKDKP